jgi:hypothetical protein
MWLLAMAGVPLLVLSLDVVTNRRLTDRLREILFRPEDTQIFEPRDEIWAWVMATFATFLVVWGLKELFVPTKVLECREEGLALKLRGPFIPPTLVPWDSIVDVDGVEDEYDGRKSPVFWLKVRTRGDLPEDPWGARWSTADELMVLAEDWAEPPREVAEKVADYAVDVARRTPTPVAASWEAGSEEE